jgi:hypothetical protein
MNKDQIKAIQSKIGATPDGFWGDKSKTACRGYLRRLMPDPNPWPKDDQDSLTAFYGPRGDESRLVTIPAPVPMAYEGRAVAEIRCHSKVAESLSRILISISLPGVPIVYDGVYNNRLMRGGHLPSLHARGAAIDLWASTNGNQTRWPTEATMPLGVMEAFAREGWLAAGAFWGRDAMHFQATQ